MTSTKRANLKGGRAMKYRGEVVVDGSPLVRGGWRETRDEALRDALALVEHVNQNATYVYGVTVRESDARVVSE